MIQLGHVNLNSGLQSDYKLIADDFIRDNLDGLVHLIRKLTGPFSHVHGIPRGGLLLEEALLRCVSPSLSTTILVIDDVLTTGGSFKRARETLSGSYHHILGVVVFARGPCPQWVRPIFQMPEPFWPRDGRA